MLHAACNFPRPPDIVQCTSAFDCKSPNAPFCAAGSCVAACQANDDCAGLAATPFCQTSSGKCVACLDASVCSADKPVCDASLNVCRGCDRDDQCVSGVCVDSQGRCAMANEIVFVSQEGIDNAMCSVAAPCRTFTAAFAATTEQRYIIHIIGGIYRMTTGVAPAGDHFVIDGSDTIIFNDHGGDVLCRATGRDDRAQSRHDQCERGYRGVDLQQRRGVALWRHPRRKRGSHGWLSQRSELVGPGRAVFFGRSPGYRTLDHGRIFSDSCGLTVLASRLNDEIDATGGKVIVENNLITSQNELQDAVLIRSSVSGSRFAFNTLVNFSGIDGTAVVLACSPGIDVSSNVFAWHSSADPGIDGCVPHDSLFDALVPAHIVGANHQADAATFFVGLNGRNLHLALTSLTKRRPRDR